MNATHLLSLFAAPASLRILVLGDMMLDVYEHKTVLGGAANVCQLLRDLQAEVSAAGVVGADEAGQQIRQLLEQAGVNSDLICLAQMRPTTREKRLSDSSAARTANRSFRAPRQSREPITTEIEDDLIRGLCRKISFQDALLIADYVNGVCTTRLMQAAIRAAQHAGIQVLIDPMCSGNFASYNVRRQAA